MKAIALFSAIASSCALLVSAAAAHAQSPAPSSSAAAILEALRDGSQSRGKPATTTSGSVPSDAARKALDQLLETSRSRGLSEPELEDLGQAVEQRRSLDLTVNFEFNSDQISSRSRVQVIALGEALRDPALRNSRILLAGHTDAKGRADYNKSLSERRAQAIRRYLIENYQLSAGNIEAVGFGKQRLKNPRRPFAEENRRVQVVNLSAGK